MKTYAVADQVPPECDYITAGKEYEVLKDKFLKDNYFVIITDANSDIVAKWEGCGFLNGGNWRRVNK